MFPSFSSQLSVGLSVGTHRSACMVGSEHEGKKLKNDRLGMGMKKQKGKEIVFHWWKRRREKNEKESGLFCAAWAELGSTSAIDNGIEVREENKSRKLNVWYPPPTDTF